MSKSLLGSATLQTVADATSSNTKYVTKAAPPASLLRQAAPSSPPILWGDNFSGTAGTTLAGRVSNVGATSATWSVVSGTWQIDGAGNLSPTTNTDGYIATITMPSTVVPTSFSISVDVKIQFSGGTSANAALIFRYVDASNFWYLQPQPGGGSGFQLYQVIAGSHKQVTQFGLTSTNGQIRTLRVDIWGRDVTVYIDSTEIYTFTQGQYGATPSANGRGSATVGFRQGISGGYATPAVFTNLRVTQYAGPKFNVPRLDSAPSTQVLTRSAAGGWDDADDNNANVVWDPVNSRWVLYYSGFANVNAGTTNQGMGLAYATTLDGPFTDDPANPIVPAAVGNIENGAIIYHFGRWLKVEDSGGWFVSSDLHTWTPLTVTGWTPKGDPFLRVNQNGLLEVWYGNAIPATAIVKQTSSDGGLTWDAAVTVATFPSFWSARGHGEPSVYVPPGKEGTEMMIFTDQVVDGSGHGVITAGITVDGGSTWHWHVIAGGSGSGFDSNQIFDSFPVFDNGVFYLFHSAATLPGGAVQLNTNIGRRSVQWTTAPFADSHPMPYQ